MIEPHSGIAACVQPVPIPLPLPEMNVARYEIRLRSEEESRIPAFPGSTLRGAFGHALKATVCVTHHRDCDNCLVSARCVYPLVFTTPSSPEFESSAGKQAPHPYILDAPVHRQRSESDQSRSGSKWERHRYLQSGDELVFGMMLLGSAIQHLPYLVLAIHRMAAHGLGVARSPFALMEVIQISAAGERVSIYDGATQKFAAQLVRAESLQDFVAARMSELGIFSELCLQFSTPTRLIIQGDLQSEANFELILRSLLRRLRMLGEVHGAGAVSWDYDRLLNLANEVKTQESQLRWWDWERYSNRQQTKMRLGGFVGEIRFEGEALQELLPFVCAGELLRLGKGTSFGLGKYEITKA